jgi:uncharacterized protein (TIGR02186 family)
VKRLLLSLLMCTLPFAARAERVVFKISQQEIGITTTFNGTDLYVTGAIVERPGKDRSDTSPGVIIAIEGPPGTATIRRKSKVAGLWINTDFATYVPVPSFYAVASTAPLGQLLTDKEDALQSISVSAHTRTLTVAPPQRDAEAFTRALADIGIREGRFSNQPGQVDLKEGALFTATFSLPSSISLGDYLVRVFLTRDGHVIEASRATFHVLKSPLERYIFQLARDFGWLYGLISIAVAILAGWMASAAFQLVRRQ